MNISFFVLAQNLMQERKPKERILLSELSQKNQFSEQIHFCSGDGIAAYWLSELGSRKRQMMRVYHQQRGKTYVALSPAAAE